MPERDVCSPVNTRSPASNKLSGNTPGYSPGAFSSPSRGDRGRRDSVPLQPSRGAGRVSRMSEEPSPFEPRTQVTGPEE